jgi:hypothetical protein
MRSPRLLKGRLSQSSSALKNFAHLNTGCRLNQRKTRVCGAQTTFVERLKPRGQQRKTVEVICWAMLECQMDSRPSLPARGCEEDVRDSQNGRKVFRHFGLVSRPACRKRSLEPPAFARQTVKESCTNGRHLIRNARAAVSADQGCPEQAASGRCGARGCPDRQGRSGNSR